jgi:hypothetical protein
MSSMSKTAVQIVDSPLATTDDMTGMADYIRSPEGRAAVERGVSDLRQGRVIRGKGSLSAEMRRRAAARPPYLNGAVQTTY